MGLSAILFRKGLILLIIINMKRSKQIALVFFTIGLLCVSSIKAQDDNAAGQMAINVGLAYGLDMEELGLRAGMTYFLNEDMRIGGDITYWLLESHEGFDQTALEINGNFNYIFYNENDLMFYGIGTLGIHYVSFSYDMGEFGSGSESDTDIGLALGAGGEYNLGSVSVFAEPKLFLSGFDQAKFNFGVRIYL